MSSSVPAAAANLLRTQMTKAIRGKIPEPLPDDILQRLRTLYILVYNDPRPYTELASEYFFITGEILEGVPPEALEFHTISRGDYLKELLKN